MVKLTAEQQHYFSKEHPEIFVPVKGAWGRRGATSLHLKHVDKATLQKAISAAWRNTAPKQLLAQFAKRVLRELAGVLAISNWRLAKSNCELPTASCSPALHLSPASELTQANP